MFENFAEQFHNSLKPVNALAAANVKTVERLVQLQTTLFTGVLEEGVAYVQGLSAQKDIAGVIEAQKTYAEGVQEKMVLAAKDAYSVIAGAQEEAGEVLKGACDQVTESATATVAKATKAAT